MNVLQLVVSALLAWQCLPAADRVAIGEVPCTDAAFFWTQDGPRQPSIDRNLQGHGMTIAGRSYQHGIAGHTGFSAVYNLSGLATSFTCLVGIDDEDHPKDPAQEDRAADLDVVVLVDRREVLRTNIRSGMAAVPLSVELAGAEQIELRGDYGRSGFLRQRIDIVDAEFTVGDRGRFLAAAAGWQVRASAERSRHVDYPAAPDWRSIGIRKVAYRGLADAYQVTTAHFELIVTPGLGGMIASFSLPGGRNILSESYDPVRIDLARGRAADGGGHFNRYQPNKLFLPPDPLLLYGRATIEFPAEGRIVMRSPESCYLFLRQGYEITIDPDGRGLQIGNIQTNTASFAQDCGIWSITRVDPASISEIRIPAEGPDPPRPRIFEPRSRLASMRTEQGWNVLPIGRELLAELGAQSLEWRQFGSPQRIDARIGGAVFSKSASPSSDGGTSTPLLHPLHLFISPKFIELEFHGPTRRIPPGGSVTLTESWNLSE